jgi:hypothetical protein
MKDPVAHYPLPEADALECDATDLMFFTLTDAYSIERLKAIEVYAALRGTDTHETYTIRADYLLVAGKCRTAWIAREAGMNL